MGEIDNSLSEISPIFMETSGNTTPIQSTIQQARELADNTFRGNSQEFSMTFTDQVIRDNERWEYIMSNVQQFICRRNKVYNIMLIADWSKTGRFHLHGFIQRKQTVKEIVKEIVYYTDANGIQDKYTMEVDHGLYKMERDLLLFKQAVVRKYGRVRIRRIEHFDEYLDYVFGQYNPQHKKYIPKLNFSDFKYIINF